MSSATAQKKLFIIGAAKCGTTSLASWLGDRDDMFLPRNKEPMHFTNFAERRWTGPDGELFQRMIVASPDAYEALFTNAVCGQWRIDASTDYLWCPVSAERLRAHADENDVRVICILRDQVDRAFSEYNHTVRDGYETRSLSRSIALEDERRGAGWQPLFYHLRRSTYHADVQRYRELFGDDFMVLDFAELRDPDTVLRKVAAFLGVEHVPHLEPEVKNASYTYVHPAARGIVRGERLARMARQVVPKAYRAAIRQRVEDLIIRKSTLRPADRRLLTERLQDDIERCIADPGIPTGTWRSAKELAGRA